MIPPDEMKIDKTFTKAMDQIDRLQKVFRDDGLLAKAVVDIEGQQDFRAIQEAFDNLYGALEDAHYDALGHLGVDENIEEDHGCGCGNDCSCGGNCGPDCNCGPSCGSSSADDELAILMKNAGL